MQFPITLISAPHAFFADAPALATFRAETEADAAAIATYQAERAFDTEGAWIELYEALADRGWSYSEIEAITRGERPRCGYAVSIAINS